MPRQLGHGYRSLSQRARVITEAWAGENLFCPCCMADRIQPFPANTRAVDFWCISCDQRFQLKGKNSPITNKILDGAYDAMLSALRSDVAPNLFLLRYNSISWNVVDLLLVPHFALSPSAIERRRPLSSTARRAGWVGCFIVLANIPADARIQLISKGVSSSPALVREQFDRLRPLKSVGVTERGWTLDVLNVVRELGRDEFTNSDIYAESRKLELLHPGNRHVRDKIRQQLQFLRDAGFIEHVDRGCWRVRAVPGKLGLPE